MQQWLRPTHSSIHKARDQLTKMQADLMDDNSTEDSDYMPEDDMPKKNAKKSEDDEDNFVHKIVSDKRKRKVNAIWDEMQQSDREYVSLIMGNSIRKYSEPVVMEIPMKRRRYQYEELLLELMGKRSRNQASEYAVDEEGEEVDNGGVEAELRERALQSIQKVQRKTVVQETRKFAGQEVVIEKTVLKERDGPAAEASSSAAAGSKKAPPTSSLDKLIDNLKGPKVISTVTKSSTDWSTYKEKEGIEDEALTKAKDGYLAKQDFLVDCDLAAFEKEKSIRESRRMKQT